MNEMKQNDNLDMDDLDRILRSEEPLEASSGFAAAVMDRVHAVSTEPPPLPFPWTRFAAGAIACGVWAAAGAVLYATIDLSTLSLASDAAASLRTAAPELGYVAAAILGTFTLLRFYRRPPTSSR
jgi:hypothetical protein